MVRLLYCAVIVALMSACAPATPPKAPPPPVKKEAPKATKPKPAVTKKKVRKKTVRRKPTRPTKAQQEAQERRWCEERQEQLTTYLQDLRRGFAPQVRNNFPPPLRLTQEEILLKLSPVTDPCASKVPLQVRTRVQLKEPRLAYRLDGRQRYFTLDEDRPQYRPSLKIFSGKVNTLTPNMTLGDYQISVRLVDIRIKERNTLQARYQINNNSPDPLTITSVRLHVENDRLEKKLGHRIFPRSGSSYTLEHRIRGDWNRIRSTLDNVTPQQYLSKVISIGSRIQFQHDGEMKVLEGEARQNFQALNARYQ